MNARRRAFSGLSIEWQLPVMVGAMVLGVTAALCWAAYVQVSRSVELAARERLSGVAAQMVNSAQASIEQLSHGAARLGAQPALQAWVRAIDDGVHSTDTAAIRLLLPRDTAILALEIWDVHRHRIYSTGQAARQVLALDSVESLDQQPVPDSGRVGRLRAIGDTVAFAAVAPVSRGGSAIGYVVLWRRATTRTRTNRQMEGLIGGSGGALLIGSSPGAWTDQATVVPPPPVTVRRPMTARYLRAGGRERLAALAPVPGSPWLIAVELPRDVVQAPARRFVANFALIAVAVLALGLLCSWVFSRRITGPLTRLTETADAISGGNQAVRASIDRRDEWGRLATAFNQMLDRVDAEAAARRDSEEQWRSLFEHSPHPMWLIDVDSLAILRVNEASVRHYGYSREEFAGMTIRDLRPPEDRSALDALIQAADPDAESFRVVRHRRKDGTIIRVEARGRPLALPGHRARLVSATDITERALLEEQLRQSQKMEAVGRLAGGVAHDFNNLLTVIGGYSEQLMGSRLNPEDHASVAEIAAAASRAAALTRQLLMFSRKQIVQHQVLDLNDVVLGVDPMLRRLLCENIELVTHLSPAAALVIADVSQLEQVIVNLAVNAADAMPTGGMLAIETAVVELDESYTSTHTEVTPGCYVRLVVSDTGAGMDANTLGKIFEPFYTTKVHGCETGLGLATVYAVAKQLGGHILVYSEPGQGATFKIYLPLAPADGVRDVPRPAAAAVQPIVSGATVLLVEDDDAVRLATRRMLERTGYSVLEANDGQCALDLVAAHPVPLHAVVTDLMMPGMDGRTFAERLLATHPGLPIVFISGYTDDAVIRRRIVNLSHTFLQKPFTRDEMTRALAGAIAVKPCTKPAGPP